jgi:hypothetical protein
MILTSEIPDIAIDRHTDWQDFAVCKGQMPLFLLARPNDHRRGSAEK